MQNKNAIFRKVALERLSSPDRLDTLMSITSPRAWIMIGMLWILIIGLIIWSVVARIPNNLEGQGLIVANVLPVSIKSPSTGQVGTILVNPGDLVNAGQPIANILVEGDLQPVVAPEQGTIGIISVGPGMPVSMDTEMFRLIPTQTDAELQTVVYVSFFDAQKVKVGQKVLVSPIDTPRQDHGFMKGEVISVATQPSQSQFAQLIYPNEPVIEVVVRLNRSDQGPSGYEWTIGDGPDEIRANTPCAAIITVEEERPIGRILPIFGFIHSWVSI